MSEKQEMSKMKQAEADALLAMEKHRADEKRYVFPMLGERLTCNLVSPDNKEKFLLDVYRGQLNLRKGTYQNRGHSTVILARLDFGGSPHCNPDGTKIPTPHLHVYREGFGDKWAIPAPPEDFSDFSDIWNTFQDFMRYCNITRPPHIPKALGLF